jgi:glycolate oxidase
MTVDIDALRSALEGAVGAGQVLTGDAISDDLTHDEALGIEGIRPAAVVRPTSTDQVAAVVAWAAANGVPVTARGAGTGMSGACIPHPDGILISFEKMAAIVEIDLANHVAVVQPGVTLHQLDEALVPHGLIYPVQPGENSASLGGNVATNAGGMRAVRYGVTRHQVLGLTAVLGTGEVITTGGKFVKATSGYDLTQLVIGSEGTLAIATEAVLRLHPRMAHGATVLVPFPDLRHVADSIPRIVGSGLNPTILEYIDFITMSAITNAAGLDLGVPQEVKDAAMAYLLVVIENHVDARVEEDTAALAELCFELGGLDVYVLPPAAGAGLIDAREKAFWTAKAMNANEIVDVVVPRAEIPVYLDRCRRSPPSTARSWWAAGTPATATCTSRCSSPTPTSATPPCTASWRPGSPSAVRCRASTASAGPRRHTSPPSRTRPRSTSCAASRPPSTPPTSSTPARSSTDTRPVPAEAPPDRRRGRFRTSHQTG